MPFLDASSTWRRLDVLEGQERMGNAVLASAGLHAAIVVAMLLASWAGAGSHASWGDPNALGGGAVGVTPVKQLPLLAREGPVNRLANDTESQVPRPETKPEPRRETAKKAAPKEDPDAIALRSRKGAKRSRPAPPVYTPKPRELASNQLTTPGGAAAASPLFGQVPGSGGLGIGNGMPFGTRCGGYSALVQDRVGQRWRTDEVDPRMRTAPPAIVTFELLRNGNIRNIRVAQSSGFLALDNSALRAVTMAGPLPPIPAECPGDAPRVEIWFQLKR
jgi:TonB family protein